MAGKGKRREALADLDPTVRKLIQKRKSRARGGAIPAKRAGSKPPGTYRPSW